jgi:thiamine kinase-like enzyme
MLAYNARYHPEEEINIPPFDASYPLVLTHQDINPRNIILGDDRRLWLVDWTWSGFYPECWEGIAMAIQAGNEERVRRSVGKPGKDPSWNEIIDVVCGSSQPMQQWLRMVRPMLDRLP